VTVHDTGDIESEALARLNYLADRTREFAEHLQNSKIALSKGGQGDRLAGAFSALVAAVEFINSFDQFRSERLAQPFVILSHAVMDVLSGTQSDLFHVARSSNRPPLQQEMLHGRMMAAVCMEMFMKAGMSRKDAADKVSRKLALISSRDLLSPGRPITGAKVAHWRDKLSGHSGSQWGRSFKRIVETNLRLGIPTMRIADKLLERVAQAPNSRKPAC
jgi:hypothetical protein